MNYEVTHFEGGAIFDVMGTLMIRDRIMENFKTIKIVKVSC